MCRAGSADAAHANARSSRMSIAKRLEKRAIIPAQNQNFSQNSFGLRIRGDALEIPDFRRNSWCGSDLIDPRCRPD